MNSRIKTIALAAALAISLGTLATTSAQASGTHALGLALATLQSGLAHAQTDLVDAEVRKVDKDNQKITLKHGELKSLDMPGMTMVFQVKDPAMLDTLKPGDKVRFKATKEDGKFFASEVQRTRP